MPRDQQSTPPTTVCPLIYQLRWKTLNSFDSQNFLANLVIERITIDNAQSFRIAKFDNPIN